MPITEGTFQRKNLEKSKKSIQCSRLSLNTGGIPVYLMVKLFLYTLSMKDA